MRNLRSAGAGVVAMGVAVTLLALAGCGRRDGAVATTNTSGAVIISERGLTSPSRATAELPVTSSGPEIRGEFRRSYAPPPNAIGWRGSGTLVPSDSAPSTPPELRLPKYESGGTTVSDVGVPYALPTLPVGVHLQPARARANDLGPAPFVETSFGPDTSWEGEGFVESSFGRDAGS